MRRAHCEAPTTALTTLHNLQDHEGAHNTLGGCAGETCEVNLVTDVIKWILPPGLRSTMAPELMDESDREYRPCLTPSSRGRLLGSGSRGQVSCNDLLLPVLVKLHAERLVPWLTLSSEDQWLCSEVTVGSRQTACYLLGAAEGCCTSPNGVVNAW